MVLMHAAKSQEITFNLNLYLCMLCYTTVMNISYHHFSVIVNRDIVFVSKLHCRLEGAGSRNRKQTFCTGQPACMRDFVCKSLCLTKWRTMKRRAGLPFLSPEIE